MITPSASGGAGTGSLTISNDGSVTDNSAFLGEGSTSAIGTVDVTGTGSTWTNNGILTIGEAGSGTVTIEDNGSVSASTVIIADQAPAVGLLQIGNNNAAGTRSCCDQTDLPVAGLLTDLKRQGLLDTTLVFWGGGFGRTPGAQGKAAWTFSLIRRSGRWCFDDKNRLG